MTLVANRTLRKAKRPLDHEAQPDDCTGHDQEPDHSERVDGCAGCGLLGPELERVEVAAHAVTLTYLVAV